ncbi:hypothetical protein [Phocaeicola sp.]
MKREKEQYEQWLEKVRKTPPLLDNPEELSAEIMQKISRIPRRQRSPKDFVRWFSAVAAGFLLCAMMYEMFSYSATSPLHQGTSAFSVSPPAGLSQESSLEQMSDMTIREKGMYLSRLWKERKEMQRKREDFINKLIDRNH